MDKELIKDSRVLKDIKNKKQVEAVDSGVSAFIVERDKTSRGTAGLVEDANQILKNEAETKEMLYQDSLRDRPLPEGTEPMFNTMFLTAKRNKIMTEGGLYLPTASFGADGDVDLNVDFSSEQTVLAVGPQCQQVEVGMDIRINIENFKIRKDENMESRVNAQWEYKIPMVVVNDVEYIRISERDVDYITDNKKRK